MIRMRLLRDDLVECLGAKLQSPMPVLAMARRLVDHGFPRDAQVEVVAERGSLGALAALPMDGAPPREVEE